jgi:hypothetical protein
MYIHNTQAGNDGVAIRTHVNDLKVSSRSREMANEVIEDLKKKCKEITIHEGMSHDYLGMLITYDREKRQVKIDTEKYINDCITSFIEEEPDLKLKQVSTPAANYLFKTRESIERLTVP